MWVAKKVVKRSTGDLAPPYFRAKESELQKVPHPGLHWAGPLLVQSCSLGTKK